MKKIMLFLLLFPAFLVAQIKPKDLRFRVSSSDVTVYDYIECIVEPARLSVVNPFTDVTLTATFNSPNGMSYTVDGFCNDQSGKQFIVRYMPMEPGLYRYVVTFQPGNSKPVAFSDSIQIQKSDRKGPLHVDIEHPWHLQYANGSHFFWNSTTTYWMMGWKDEGIITSAIDRLAGYGINRIRVAINGRAHGGDRWNEPYVQESPNFTFKLNPWLAQRPEDLDNPGFDVTRFNVPYWQKLDRLVQYAREKGVIVSLIFYVDGLDHGCDPFKKTNMGNADEQRYYRYAVSRYAAFENIMWDVANEYHLFRSEDWVNKMGMFIKNIDPAKHLISVHGNADFPFRKSPWVDVVLYQSWDECGGYDFMTTCRQKQAATGRPLPQINEEYGYEDHYSTWGCGPTTAKERPDGRSANNRVRLAWEMCMAGCYQTTGERADEGTGTTRDGGGGWINGRGNAAMSMLTYYAAMRKIFEQTDYWKMTPHPELVAAGNMCLAEPGSQYLIYTRLPHCRLQLPAGQRYSVIMFDPLTGASANLADADSDADMNAWQYRKNLTSEKVFLLKRKN